MNLINTPEVKLAIVAVSRNCFPMSLSESRLNAVKAACDAAGVNVIALKTIIENEKDTLKALEEAASAGANAAMIYLGNFGPEGPESIFAKRFDGPVGLIAAAEEHGDGLMNDRGDAYCGVLNASYNFALRNVRVHIPEIPTKIPTELVCDIKHFINVARVVIGVKNLKIIGFGPRPEDFYACNAPVKPMYDLGVEVMENSELDLLVEYNSVKEDDEEVIKVIKDMTEELGSGNNYPDVLPRIARFEVALMRYYKAHLGACDYAVFANKCWPAFQTEFGFVPCYVNSRLAKRGIPVACEVDLYGALSEYMVQLASMTPATLLDINNTVPNDMIAGNDLKEASPADLFMGFHCGNTATSCMTDCALKYQLIMNRGLENCGEPDITRGTIEGTLRPGATTVFRLQSSSDCKLSSYIAEGNIIDMDPKSFGSIGVFGIPNFARFYRHVLVAGNYPHHAAVGFSKCGKVLFDALYMLGVDNVKAPLPEGILYKGENPF